MHNATFRRKQLRSNVDQIDAVARNYRPDPREFIYWRYIIRTTYKIIGLSHVRVIPTTLRPWEHDGVYCLIRKHMPKNNEDKTYIIEPEIGLFKLELTRVRRE